MATYVIVDVEITDAVLHRQFMERVTGTVESHGGRFVVRGEAIRVVEGSWSPTRLAVLEFPDAGQVDRWLGSPGYTALDDLRSRSSRINMVVVEGS